MPTIDIYLKLNGFWYERKVYRDVKNHSINYTDYQVMIQFTRTDKKNKTREYMIAIPKTNLSFIVVVINE